MPSTGCLVARAQLRPHVNRAPERASASTQAVSADRSRLLLRLEQYGLCERAVKGDGACQFRSLSDQLYGTPKLHRVVRSVVVKRLKDAPQHYQQYVPGDAARGGWDRYLSDMKRPHAWGDHVTLQAAADAYGLRIIVVTSFKENSVLAIEPAVVRSSRYLWLSFWAEVHYNSLYPREDPPGPLSDGEDSDGPTLLGSRTIARWVLGS